MNQAVLKILLWLRASGEETPGRASGKALTGFSLALVIIFACIIAIKYSPNHILPSEMFWGVCGLITSLFAVKSINRYIDKKNPTENIEPNLKQ